MTQPTPGKWPTPAIIVTCVIGLVVEIFLSLAIIGSFMPPSTADKTVAGPTLTPAPPKGTATVPAPPATTKTTPPPLTASQFASLHPNLDEEGNFPPVPDTATTSRYIGTLDGINPEILEGGPTDALVARGRDQCRDFKERPKSSWVFQAQQRFNSPDHPDGFDVSTTERIIAAVRKYICPGY